MTTNNNPQCFTQKHDVQPVVYATPRLSIVHRIMVLCMAVCFVWGVANPQEVFAQKTVVRNDPSPTFEF